MVSELARGDWEDLAAQGLAPTLDDFDRLNSLALRLTDGAETTAANFPRIGWAGDVPFFEPTVQAFAWYHEVAGRTSPDGAAAGLLWAFALAHGRTPRFFDGLARPDDIDRAVEAWSKGVNATADEIARACRYAARGFDDAEASRPDSDAVRRRADKTAAAENLAELERVLARACAALHATPDALKTETPSRLERLCEAAAVELGRPLGRDEARLRADYDLTLREIVRRLKAEWAAAERPGAVAEGAGSQRMTGKVLSANGPRQTAGDSIL